MAEEEQQLQHGDSSGEEGAEDDGQLGRGLAGERELQTREEARRLYTPQVDPVAALAAMREAQAALQRNLDEDRQSKLESVEKGHAMIRAPFQERLLQLQRISSMHADNQEIITDAVDHVYQSEALSPEFWLHIHSKRKGSMLRSLMVTQSDAQRPFSEYTLVRFGNMQAADGLQINSPKIQQKHAELIARNIKGEWKCFLVRNSDVGVVPVVYKKARQSGTGAGEGETDVAGTKGIPTPVPFTHKNPKMDQKLENALSVEPEEVFSVMRDFSFTSLPDFGMVEMFATLRRDLKLVLNSYSDLLEVSCQTAVAEGAKVTVKEVTVKEPKRGLPADFQYVQKISMQDAKEVFHCPFPKCESVFTRLFDMKRHFYHAHLAEGDSVPEPLRFSSCGVLVTVKREGLLKKRVRRRKSQSSGDGRLDQSNDDLLDQSNDSDGQPPEKKRQRIADPLSDREARDDDDEKRS